jgi:hypothetical protein
VETQNIAFAIFVVLGITSACRRTELVDPVVVHVLRDPSAPFATNLERADWQFASAKPHLNNGKGVMIATNEGRSFPILLRKLDTRGQELLILNSQKDVSEVAGVRNHIGRPQLICGGASAYVPDWVSGDEREATEMYLRFLVAHCDGGT